jgi:hypothetical protein
MWKRTTVSKPDAIDRIERGILFERTKRIPSNQHVSYWLIHNLVEAVFE